MAIDAIVEAELRRALAEPAPLRGIVARWSRAAPRLRARPGRRHPHQVLGGECMSRRLHEGAPRRRGAAAGGACERPCGRCSHRAAAELHRDAFVIDDAERSTVDLAGHRGDRSLDDLDLDVNEDTASRPA
jgi:hypothetical protein